MEKHKGAKSEKEELGEGTIVHRERMESFLLYFSFHLLFLERGTKSLTKLPKVGLWGGNRTDISGVSSLPN